MSLTMEKVFSPLFTTKPVGKGTRLGLSVCNGIINNIGGIIRVSSTLGGDATFIPRLPASG
jgi:two-component system NtrC family sensor kinase